MILSNANSTARSLEFKISACGNVEKLVDGLKKCPPQLLLIDLQTPGLNVADLASKLGEMELQVRIVAFAQHVNVEIIEQAKGLFDEVMTRGQFNKSVAGLIEGIKV